MDELLFDRVKQLREIDDRLERLTAPPIANTVERLIIHIADLRRDLALMIQHAEEAHAAF